MNLIKTYGGSTSEESNSPPQTVTVDKKTAEIGIAWRRYTSELFVSKEDSDVVVVAGDVAKGEEGKEIKLHNVVLQSRVPDFANILKHDVKEKVERKIYVTDYSYEVMYSFFEFAYCGTVSNIDELACELLKVADKYQFVELKELCSEKIAKNLNVGNAATICSIAFYSQADTLLKLSKDFLMQNFHECRYENPGDKSKKERQSWLNIPRKVMDDILEFDYLPAKKQKV